MKIRKGYVSNSSSSSFICEVCGTVESGYDISLRDVGMVECEHGHIFCEYHLTVGDTEFDEDGCCLEKNCPICTLEEMRDGDILTYLFNKYNITREDVISEVRAKFKNYKEFEECLRK